MVSHPSPPPSASDIDWCSAYLVSTTTAVQCTWYCQVGTIWTISRITYLQPVPTGEISAVCISYLSCPSRCVSGSSSGLYTHQHACCSSHCRYLSHCHVMRRPSTCQLLQWQRPILHVVLWYNILMTCLQVVWLSTCINIETFTCIITNQ